MKDFYGVYPLLVDFTAAAFCLFARIIIHVHKSLWLCECVCSGKEARRKQTLQSSVRCQNQQAEGGWWFTERRGCSLLASVVSAELSSMWHREAVDILTSRQQLKGAQPPVTHWRRTAFTRLSGWKWIPCEERRRRRKFSGVFKFRTVKVIIPDSFA